MKMAGWPTHYRCEQRYGEAQAVWLYLRPILFSAQIAKNDNGRPFIVVRDQGKRKMIHGRDAIEQGICAARTVSGIAKTALGPRGLDQDFISPNGDITVTNDGATILEQMEIKEHIAKLLVSPSQGQDAEIVDGTAGVVVLTDALPERASGLIDKASIHPDCRWVRYSLPGGNR